MVKFTPWKQSVLYQLYPWTFYEDTERTPQLGNGSIRGMTEKIPYFVDLGVDAIWVAPPYPGPMVDSGYDTTDMSAIHPSMGTMADFDELVAKSHENGLRVMLDFIPNHTSLEHEWFQKSRRHEDGYDDWYIWHPGTVDEQGNHVPPNNWASDFSKPNRKARDQGEMPWLADDDWTPPISAWQWDEVREEFYLHHFLVEQADLNWSKREVRDAIKECMRFWLDHGVDAFRMDAVNHMGKNMDFPDEEINPAYSEKEFDNPYYQLQARVSSNYPDTMHFYVREMCSVVREPKYKGRDIHLVLEAYAEEDDLHAMNELDPEVASSFNFAPFHLPWQAEARKKQMDEYYKNFSTDGIPNQIFGNHDNSRIATRFGDGAARSIAVLSMTVPGMGIIYSGDELGLHDGVIPADHPVRDPNAFRDSFRTPIIWDDTLPNGGFSGADLKDLWLPIHETDLPLAASRQLHDPESTFELYKAVISLRREHAALREGSYGALTTNNEDVLAFERRAGDERVVVLVNFSGEYQTATCAEASQQGTAILSSIDVAQNPRAVDLAEGVVLGPNEALVIAL